MSNFVSNSDANALMSEIGKKKLTVTDVMPSAASAANEGIPYLYLGTTTQDFTNGSIYECQEVTPATDPKTYEWVEKYQSNVDLTYYKRIWGGTEAGWDQLTDEQKANYEYMFFDGDDNYYLPVVDAVTKDDMHPVTSNAVAEEVEDLDSEIADVVNTYSAKNLLPYPYYQTTQKVANVDVTDNGDGTITVNGTSNSNSVIFRYLNNDLKVHIPLENKKYKVSFDVENVWGASFHFGDMRLIKQDDTTYTFGQVTGDFIIDNTSGEFKGIETFAIYIAANIVVDNVTIKPMIRLASIENDTWVPYAKTNKEITDAITYKTKSITSATRYSDISSIVSSFRDDMPPYVKAYRSDGFYLYLYLNTMLLMSDDIRFGGANASGPYIHGLRISSTLCDFVQVNTANNTSQSLWDTGTWTLTMYY